MRRLVFCLLAMVLPVTRHYAQQLSESEYMARLAGMSSVEEMSEDEADRLADYLEHPLRLNMVSLRKLQESGLLTIYQAVSLTDYRSRHGDVLSYSELAAVDGFGEGFVSRIRPFVSLESIRTAGNKADVRRVSHEAAVRTGCKTGGDMPEYGVRYRMEASEQLSCGIAVTRGSSAESMRPDALSGYVAWHFRKVQGKIVAGDFNARFGQGLALWNGMGMSSVSSPSSFIKKASGLSLTSSFTGNYALRGLGTDLYMGPIRLTSLVALGKEKREHFLLPALNISWYGPDGSVGLTHYAEFRKIDGKFRIPDMKTSLDMAFCISGIDLFSEIALDWVTQSAALLAGAVFRAGEDVRLGTMLRYYPAAYSPARSAAARSTTRCSNEYAFSFSTDYSCGRWIGMSGMQGFGSSVRRCTGVLALDAAYFPIPKSAESSRSIQLKVQAEWKIMLSGSFRADLRLVERFRTWGDMFRTDIRADLRWFSGKWNAVLRLNALKCSGWGLLGYAEGGYVSGSFSLYGRMGAFRIDDWDDRIYVYERNAPGTFSVPAYYGRGVWAAFTAGWKYARWGKLYARAAVVTYPFMIQKKPGKAELKLQCMFDF